MWLILLIGSTLTLVMSACAGATPTPTPTPTPTSSPVKEWNLEGIQVDGSTVTVQLYVFAGIDVRATLDGRDADQLNALVPILEFVFTDVAPGKHTVEVEDVVGYTKTAEFVVPSLTPASDVPDWLTDLIQRLQNGPVASPPASIAQYEFRGEIVYFLPQRCCDIWSNLYDVEGDIIGHPDGGITGEGDGRVPSFFELRSNERLIWKDERTYVPSQVQVPAPVESVEVLVMESFPPQYALVVVSGLPNACISFGGYRLDRDGTTIRIEMVNWKPADPQVVCA